MQLQVGHRIEASIKRLGKGREVTLSLCPNSEAAVWLGFITASTRPFTVGCNTVFWGTVPVPPTNQFDIMMVVALSVSIEQ